MVVYNDLFIYFLTMLVKISKLKLTRCVVVLAAGPLTTYF